MNMNGMGRNVIIWVALAILLTVLFMSVGNRAGGQQMKYNVFSAELKAGNIQNIVQEQDGRTLKVTTKGGQTYTVVSPVGNIFFVDNVEKAGAELEAKPVETNRLFDIFLSLLPILLLIGVWFYVMQKMQGGGKGGAFSFGKSRARMLDENQNQVTLNDVAGVEEAKEEVGEIVDFLRDPGKFQKLGGRIPRGVLMVGPPGTGKTLLARAIAGEAKVPFFTISGSDFVEMFVGVGAARVRDMFEQAKKNAPCIIFIDEIDAVGRQRGAGLGGGNDEREQTLNQMLVEMDGFEGNSGVIVIAATNRPDVLDPALLRPGRFDRQVTVNLPDIRGREQILKVHMRKVPVSPDVDPLIIARGTPGFSGADLANIVNEAALFAARSSKRLVDMIDFEEARDKIYMGAARKSMVMTQKEKHATAVHEAGHAIIATVLKGNDPVHKVTIVPRGRALGVTWTLPQQDRLSQYKNQMLDQISMMFGGRIAEELYLEDISTGASNDYERATGMARAMVTRFGMGEGLGPMVYAENEGEVFLGRSMARQTNMSDETQRKVDAEIRRILETQYQIATDILKEKADHLKAMTAALMEYETIDADQVDDIMSGRPVRAPRPAGSFHPGGGSGSGSAGSEVKPEVQPEIKPEAPQAPTA
jgi:cell division protease FtsH